MINFFKQNIKEVMEWSEAQFQIFYSRYKEAYSTYRDDTKSILYNEEYLDCVLSLFLVYKHKITNKKAFLISIILNGLRFDTNNLYPNSNQDEFIDMFFNTEDIKLITIFNKNTISSVKYLLSTTSRDEVYSDTVLKKDLQLFDDFRNFFRAIKVPTLKTIVVYHMNPQSVMYQKPKHIKLDFEAIIKQMNKIKLQIKDDNLQDLYGFKIQAFIKFYSNAIYTIN